MQEPKYTINEIVFARCRNQPYWPGRIAKILSQYNIYKISFINHNSTAYIQQKDLLPLTKDNIRIQKKAIISKIRENRLQNRIRSMIFRAIQVAEQQDKSQRQQIKEQSNNILTGYKQQTNVEFQQRKQIISRQRQLTLDDSFEAARKRKRNGVIMSSRSLKKQKLNQEESPSNTEYNLNQSSYEEGIEEIEQLNYDLGCVEYQMEKKFSKLKKKEKYLKRIQKRNIEEIQIISLHKNPIIHQNNLEQAEIKQIQQKAVIPSQIQKDEQYSQQQVLKQGIEQSKNEDQQPKMQQQKSPNVLLQEQSHQSLVEHVYSIQPNVEIMLDIKQENNQDQKPQQILQVYKQQPIQFYSIYVNEQKIIKIQNSNELQKQKVQNVCQNDVNIQQYPAFTVEKQVQVNSKVQMVQMVQPFHQEQADRQIQIQSKLKAQNENDDFDIESIVDQVVQQYKPNSPISVKSIQNQKVIIALNDGVSQQEPVQINEQQAGKETPIQQELSDINQSNAGSNDQQYSKSHESSQSEQARSFSKEEEEEEEEEQENYVPQIVQQKQMDEQLNQSNKQQINKSNQQESNMEVAAEQNHSLLVQNNSDVRLVQDDVNQEDSMVSHTDQFKEPSIVVSEQKEPQQNIEAFDSNINQQNHDQLQQKSIDKVIVASQQQQKQIQEQEEEKNQINQQNNKNQQQQENNQMEIQQNQPIINTKLKQPRVFSVNLNIQQLLQEQSNPVFQILQKPVSWEMGIKDVENEIQAPNNFISLVGGLDIVQQKLKRFPQNLLVNCLSHYINQMGEYLKQKTQNRQLLLSMTQRQIFMAIITSNHLDSIVLEQASILEQLRWWIQIYDKTPKKNRASNYRLEYLMAKVRLEYFQFQLQELKNKVISMNSINKLRLRI